MDLIWKPIPRQEDFIAIPDSVSEGLYGGAAGGGKSEILLMLPLVRQWYQNRRFKGLLTRRTYPELEKSLIIRSETDGYYKGTGAEYNKQLRRWRWPSGAILDFGYAEYENDVRKYDTSEYTYIGFDELTSFTEFQYMYLAKSRCRTTDPSIPAIVRGATNPGNVGHGWVRKRFVEPAPYGTLLRDRTTGEMRVFIQSLPTDNPYIMKNDPGYIKRLEQLPEAEKRAKLYGDWWTFSGQVFDDWRIEPFADEPSNARHVISPFQIPDYWPVVLGLDWGFTAMTWAGWMAASPEGRAYLCEEYACSKTKISTWATEVGTRSGKYRLVDVVLDPSAWGHVGAERTIAEQFHHYSGLNPRQADNDRLGGKMLLQDYLRWVPRPPKKIPETGFNSETAEMIRRISGQKAYEDYCDRFVPEPPETNLPKLQVFDTCKEFIKTIPLCVYNEVNHGNVEDVAEFDGDDPYDGGRYAIKAVERYFETARRDSVSVKMRASILEDFEKTGDYTALHRKMEKFERASKGVRAVRRYHRASVAPGHRW